MKTLTCAFVALSLTATLAWADSGVGIFTDQGDVGSTGIAGSASYNANTGEYTIAGGGANLWMTNDSFHFVWVKMSGDFTLAADVKFVGTSAQPHRKACLLIRQSLDADSAYADVAVHGIGMTALQYRETAGDMTREIMSSVSSPTRVRLEKHGDLVYMSVAATNDDLQPAGAMYRIAFKEPFYVGLGVCAHDNSKIESAIFSNVKLEAAEPVTTNEAALESTLETLELASLNRQVVYHTPDHIEAPNWARDGSYLLFNRQGRIWKLPVTNGTPGTPELLDTGGQTNCNNDHGLSPDGKWLAVSDQTLDGKSHVYVLPSSGGEPRQLTPLGPSYWHGWSPNGKTVAYCAERNGNFDVYSMRVKGGKEKRLTTAPGLDDGPDYSPDGKYIYFNSERTGLMQIWRMKPNGSDQEQITSDNYNNWFAHPSPDGKWLVFLTYGPEVKGHPPGQDVMLRLMSLPDQSIQLLAKLYGGQGTINVPSWSPDSKDVAFVSYQLEYP
jgi:WD40 repeat protein